jgi:hypothetical protein
LAGVAVAFALFSPGEVNAGGVVVYTWGDTISHVGQAQPQARQGHWGSNVGYKYHYLGAFWIDLWTSDGTYCVYESGSLYEPISSAEAAKLLGKSESDLTTPFLYRWPLGWMIFGPVVIIWVIIYLLVSWLKNDAGWLSKWLSEEPLFPTLAEEWVTEPVGLGADGKAGVVLMKVRRPTVR